MKIKLTQKEVNRAKILKRPIQPKPKKAAPKIKTMTCELIGNTFYLYHPKLTIKITRNDMNEFVKWILKK